MLLSDCRIDAGNFAVKDLTRKSFDVDIHGCAIANPAGPSFGNGEAGADLVGADKNYDRALHP